MEKTILMATLVLLGGAVALTAWGDTEVVDGIEWTYVVSDGKASVGTGDSSHRAVPNTTKGGITIPSKLGGMPVTGISNAAFWHYASLTNITIPPSVTSIGNDAFSGCSGLTSIAIPSNVTRIGNYAFDSCSGLTSLTIPQAVTSIGTAAFSYCSGLTSITIPPRVTNISGFTFFRCVGLTSVTVPDGVTSIGEQAFYDCKSLTSITMPSNLTCIGRSAFYNCSGLSNVKIPTYVTSIGEQAFYNCYGLANMTIPSSVTSIGGNAFYNCSGILWVKFFGQPPIGVANSGLLSYAGIFYYPRQCGEAWQSLTGGVPKFGGYVSSEPSVKVVSSSIRANDPTILDVVYRVMSKKPTVKVRVLAFEDGERSFAKVVRPETFVTDTNGLETACNVGDNITPNVEHTISWRVSSDWTTKLAKVKFEVLARDGELLPLELMTIPASDQYGKMKVAWNRISGYRLFDAILWLYADHDPELTLSDGTLKWNDIVVAWNSRIEGRYIGGGGGYDYTDVYTYVFGKMGYLFANYNILKYINEETRLGLSMSYGGGPGNARYYAYKIVEE